ncbi:hypothetical protein R5R35_010266 [Gryllus longicercus]|uniref:WAP domain-containing protein n=1 Tax=Gryllus longicercus TaxID=2509291 RepID=A0AAN9VDG6_9ORTH
MATCTSPATASCAAAAAAAAARCRRAPPLALLAVGVAALAVLACAPAPAAAQKPGSCPPPAGVHVCVFKCYDDSDCWGEQKCCKTLCGGSMCINSVSAPRPRPPGATEGVCPAISSTPWVCRSRCSSDLECGAGRKCCQHRCGGYSCLPAVARRQRAAPAPAPAPDAAAAADSYDPEYSVVEP